MVAPRDLRAHPDARRLLHALRMIDPEAVSAFTDARPRLLGLAYRMLGSVADAEDVVQDTYVQWQEADRVAIREPVAWLTTVCTRRCVDVLKSAQRTRMSYVGPWLPEPVLTAWEESPSAKAELASSVTTAFLLLLERLAPKERAAYLLHDIFETGYPEVARTLGIEEAACRKLVSRAREHVGEARARHAPPRERQNRLVAAFQLALNEGTLDPLAALLAEDCALTADGGGKVLALPYILKGRSKVLRFIDKAVRPGWSGCEAETAEINGALGLIVRHEGSAVAVLTLGAENASGTTDLFIMRNPDKLRRFDARAEPIA